MARTQLNATMESQGSLRRRFASGEGEGGEGRGRGGGGVTHQTSAGKLFFLIPKDAAMLNRINKFK